MVLSSPFFCDACGAANRSQAAFCFACGQLLRRQGGKHASSGTGLLVSNHLLKQRYRILQQVGKGGFGAVYKAADLQFGNRLVAIKEMSQNNLSAQELAEATAAFNREAMLLAGLTHPNLPRIYEQFTDMGRWYLVMDFIEGETMEEHLHKVNGKKLPVEKVLEIGIQLCAVLEYLHMRQPPIIFRDLKPANIMLTPHGHIYLIDFGIARHFKPGQAKDTTALGSSGYAAPEQYGRAQTTPRADIYALGATLHQMLSGNDPSDSPFHFAPLQLGNHPILGRLETLIMHMLEVDINKRPDNIAIVKQELQSIATQYLVSRTHPLAPNIPPGYQPPQQAQVPTAPKTPKRTALPRAQSNTRFICAGHSSRVLSVAWSPRGTHIASASYDKTVRVWDAANGNSMIIFRGHWSRVHIVAWSPDGRHIASGGDDGTVQVWDALSGNSVYTYRGHAQAVYAVAWSPDGRRIASAGADKTVQVWDALTGSNVFSHRGHSGAVHTVSWSPDGRRIASGSEDKTVQVWNPVRDKNSFFTSFLLSSRGQFTFKGHSQRVNALMWSLDGRRIASVSYDRTMQVWDSMTGRKYFVHHNPVAAINTVCWSPDGRYLASGSNDKTVQVWDAGTRRSRSGYRGHTGYVTAVAWSPDGKLLASGSVDHTVQVWQPI
ncbi:MAG TPA: WD40 repeat domain-containing serine/threonine-protein kinase [Ktedonobacteraceae bacterium]|jgi:WD40 repeat protein/tRNA A-37 threonylcarbamoyl transferase component Bud32|nr:WD40 repeat domain-containing serine/threonine-protein kinase [Ktedonobacteraceae bacterium]